MHLHITSLLVSLLLLFSGCAASVAPAQPTPPAQTSPTAPADPPADPAPLSLRHSA